MDKVIRFLLCLFVFCLMSCGEAPEPEKYYPESGQNGEDIIYPELPGAIIEFPSGEPYYYLTANDISVPVYEQIKVNVGDPNQSHELYLTGAGVRVKKVFIFSANVYVLSSYVSDLSAISEEYPLEDIQTSQVKALHLTALRDIEAADIRSSFEDALRTNNIDLNRPAVSALINEITFDIKAGEEITFIGWFCSCYLHKVLILASDKTITAGDETLANDLWKIWFGIAVDDEGRDLQDQLIEDLPF